MTQTQETQWYQDRQTVALYFTLLFFPQEHYFAIELFHCWKTELPFLFGHDTTSVPLAASTELQRGELEEAMQKQSSV